MRVVFSVFIVGFLLGAECKIPKQPVSKYSIDNVFGVTNNGQGNQRQHHNQEGWLLGQFQPTRKQGFGGLLSGGSFGQTGPFNFYDRLPKVVEVVGVGLLWIRTFSIASGIPYFYPILIPLLVILSIILTFLPNEEINFVNVVTGARNLISGLL